MNAAIEQQITFDMDFFPFENITTVDTLDNSTSNDYHMVDETLIQQAFQVVNQDLSDAIVISDLAHSLYVSESKLYKTFINYYGESPKKFFMKYKMQLSLMDLTVQGYSLDRIALKYGFGNGCQYSKSFKKIMGYSPRKA